MYIKPLLGKVLYLVDISVDSNHIILDIRMKEPTEKISKSLINVDLKFLELLYKDLAQPSVKKVGSALSDIFGLASTITIPFMLLNKMLPEKAELHLKKHMEEYRKKMENIPEEKVISVQPEIGIPILEKLGYTQNETLAELYLNLLKNASSSDSVASVHPRFVNIISEISSDEAKILETLELHEPGTLGAVFRQEIPCISILRLLHIPDGATTLVQVTKIEDKFTEFEESELLLFKKNSKMYFDNLVSLSLLEYSTKESVTANYSKLYEIKREIVERIMQEPPVGNIHVENGVFLLTSFGYAFLEACRKT